jgi:DNA-binding NarL/FixJ family response regulator
MLEAFEGTSFPPGVHRLPELDLTPPVGFVKDGSYSLVLSARIEVEHMVDLRAGQQAIGYLLKSRIAAIADFLDTLQQIAKGALVVEPGLVAELISTRRSEDALIRLSTREHKVLTLMAQGRLNTGIARQLGVT